MDWSSGRAVGRCQTQRAGQSAESCPREQGGWQQREPLPLGLVLWAGRRMGFTQHSHPMGSQEFLPCCTIFHTDSANAGSWKPSYSLWITIKKESRGASMVSCVTTLLLFLSLLENLWSFYILVLLYVDGDWLGMGSPWRVMKMFWNQKKVQLSNFVSVLIPWTCTHQNG